MEPLSVAGLGEFYRAYGESLASRLSGIAHQESNPRFIFIEDMGDPQEVKAKSSLFNGGGNVLVWEDFQEDLDTAGRDNYHSKITGSLAILAAGGTDRAAKRTAYTSGRLILLKAIGLMIQDSQDGPLEQNNIRLEVREFPCEKIGPVGDKAAYGYGVQFTWHVPLDLDLSEGDVLAD